jgi:hypothetical protein
VESKTRIKYIKNESKFGGDGGSRTRVQLVSLLHSFSDQTHIQFLAKGPNKDQSPFQYQ